MPIIRSKYSTYTSFMLKEEAKGFFKDYRRAGLTGMECCELLELEHPDLVDEMKRTYRMALSEVYREAMAELKREDGIL